MHVVLLIMKPSLRVAIREMASVPIESMKTGGMLWFSDLTVPDPYYVLPVLSCLSFMATIEVCVLLCVHLHFASMCVLCIAVL